MAIESLAFLMEAGKYQDLFDVILYSDCIERGVTKEQSLEQMKALYKAICRAKDDYDPDMSSSSGMVGGDGAKMREYVRSGKTICGEYMGGVIAQAIEMGESNACMKCIVAAPTAGSCGVLPAVMRYCRETRDLSLQEQIHALAIAGLIGNTVKKNGSISGAEVGCQGEIGVACSMAAAAAAAIFGGTLPQIEYAAEIGLEHFLGLTCDPVMGLVQIPCIERNAIAANRAVVAAEMALLSDGSHFVSFDTVVQTKLKTGKDMPSLYRETTAGGLSLFTREKLPGAVENK